MFYYLDGGVTVEVPNANEMQAMNVALFPGTTISKEILAISVNNLISVFFMLKALKTLKTALKGYFSYTLCGYGITRFRKPLSGL